MTRSEIQLFTLAQIKTSLSLTKMLSLNKCCHRLLNLGMKWIKLLSKQPVFYFYTVQLCFNYYEMLLKLLRIENLVLLLNFGKRTL